MKKETLYRLIEEVMTEEDCWAGYSPGAQSGVKTKEGDSGRVNNCEEIVEEEEESCKPSKGKRFADRVDGKCRSYGQKGPAKGGGDRIQPGSAKGDAYCARSAEIPKCKEPPCANDLSRKKWKCKGKKSEK
tara:strand:- start:241 stop:633 length:393 start_codon:yes stop_codon:yes gene_type:complete